MWHQIWVWTPSQLTNWSTISSLMLSFSAFSCHLDNPYSKSASRPSTVSMTTWTSAQLHLSPYPPMACSNSAEPWPNSQSDCVYILSSTPSLLLWCMALADSLVRNLYSQQCFNFFSKQNMNRIVILILGVKGLFKSQSLSTVFYTYLYSSI